MLHVSSSFPHTLSIPSPSHSIYFPPRRSVMPPQSKSSCLANCGVKAVCVCVCVGRGESYSYFYLAFFFFYFFSPTPFYALTQESGIDLKLLTGVLAPREALLEVSALVSLTARVLVYYAGWLCLTLLAADVGRPGLGVSSPLHGNQVCPRDWAWTTRMFLCFSDDLPWLWWVFPAS